MKHLVLVDTNCLGFAGMAAPKLHAGEVATQSVFTTLKKVRNLYLDYPNALIMCLYDGRSWRKDIISNYKANREVTEKQVELRREYFDQRAVTVKGLKLLGVTIASADNYEADDLADYYSRRKWQGNKVTLVTADQDWLQLVNPKTEWVDPINVRSVNDTNFEAFTGCKTPWQFVEKKCMLGDVGDNIKGFPGVGKVTANKFFGCWDSYEAFCNDELFIETWNEVWDSKIPAALANTWRSFKSEELFLTNMKLMDLSTVYRPEPNNLKVVREPFHQSNFEQFCYENAFTSITRDLERFLKPFKENQFVRV